MFDLYDRWGLETGQKGSVAWDESFDFQILPQKDQVLVLLATDTGGRVRRTFSHKNLR